MGGTIWRIPYFASIPRILLLQRLNEIRGRAMAQAGRDHMNARVRAHQDAIRATGIGVYYGDKAEFSNFAPSERPYQVRGMNDSQRRDRGQKRWQPHSRCESLRYQWYRLVYYILDQGRAFSLDCGL